MANPEHLKILKQGVGKWNKWKVKNKFVEVDLSEADLAQENLNGVDFNLFFIGGVIFNAANLQRANLGEANLADAGFHSANFGGATFWRANLNGAKFNHSNGKNSNFVEADLTNADFSDADLSHAILSSSKLNKTNFFGTKLDETDFSNCSFNETTIAFTDLSSCIGLETVKVFGPCVVDFYTLQKSRNLPRSFLIKIGLPELFINELPKFQDLLFHPAFISYSSKNTDFANKLYEALIARGVQVWYDEKKMKPGDDIYESLSRGIEVYDKMILVCSRQSLAESWWVDREIDRILAKERQLRKERGKRINLLIPIRIDDHIFEWDGAKGEEVRRYIVGDFRDWQDEARFQKALDELIAALNVDRGEDAPPSFL